MHNNTLAAFIYDSSSIDFCLFDCQSFFIGHFIDEDIQLTLTKSIIIKNNIRKVFLSLDVEIDKFQIIKGLCEVELTTFKRSTLFAKSQNLTCFYTLKEILRITGVFREIVDDTINENSLIRIGLCNNFPVYIIEQDNHFYYDNLTMQDLEVISGDDDTLSLFQKMNFTKTIFGETTLKSWLLHPLNDLKAIIERQNMITLVEEDIVSDILNKISSFYKGKEIDLLKLKDFIIQSFKLIASLSKTLIAFTKELDVYEKILFDIDIIDDNHLKEGISQDYDELKEIYENLPSRLRKVATNLAFRNNVKLSVVYFPHIGYLIESSEKDIDEYTMKKIIEDKEDSEVESLCKSMASTRKSMNNDFLKSSTSKCSKTSFSKYSIDQSKTGDYTIFKDKIEKALSRSQRNKRFKSSFECVSSMTEKSSSECFSSISENFISSHEPHFTPYTFYLKNSLYIKNYLMNTLDEDLGDIFNLMEEIKRKEIHDRTISLDFSLINDLVSYIGKIDALSSLNRFKKKYNCIKPQLQIHKEDNWNIKIVNFFYENIQIDIDKSLIFRGSQKILKTVGQISIISQLGSFVPCISVSIPIFDKLFTSMNVKESIGNSYFLSSVRRMGTILQFSNNKSLVLLDSFGYGTNIDEAYKIFLSIHKNIRNPVVLSLTQFSHLFTKRQDEKENIELNKIKDKYLIRCENKTNNQITLSEEFNDEFDDLEKCLHKNGFQDEFIHSVKTEFDKLKR